MPNWCLNWGFITVAASHAEEVKAAIEEARFLNYIAPAPEDDVNWQRQNWGTKWEIDLLKVSVVEEDNEKVKLDVSFQTAWCPPHEAFQKLWEMEHIHDIEMYAEEGGDCYCCYWKNGETEEFHDYEAPEDDTEDDDKHFEHYLEWVYEKLGQDLRTQESKEAANKEKLRETPPPAVKKKK